MGKNMSKRLLTAALPLFLLVFSSCSDDDGALAPYEDAPAMSAIQLQSQSYQPKITWIGGYVSVIGANRGTKAALDSTLVWLAHSPQDDIKYPIVYGQTPAGASDITAQYGGTYSDKLIEDQVYTFWTLKKDVWDAVAQNSDKTIALDSALARSGYAVVSDTLKLSKYDFVQSVVPLDVYINIDPAGISQTRGRLGKIYIAQPDTGNNIIVNWDITWTGITDTNISAMGIVEGGQYDVNFMVWEIYSEETVDGATVFGKKNVISRPVLLGQTFAGTRTFGTFPANGLQRNKTYYLWIASKEWNGKDRLLSTTGYSYLTFKTL
jgi:hypothetical protein